MLLTLTCHTQSLMGGWLNHYSLRCQPVDYTDNPIATRVSYKVLIYALGSGNATYEKLTYSYPLYNTIYTFRVISKRVIQPSRITC